MWIPFLVVAFFLGKGNTKECAPYFVGNDLVACICNSTYCDDTPNDNQPKLPESGTFYWYVTNKEGLRMKMSTAKFSGRDSHDSSSNVTLVINRKKTYQRIIGFGGAFTDATGINLRNLSTATQDQLIRAYYDPKVGSGYNIARIPIGATDASTGPYSYDDIVGDTSLKHFALTQEDHDYKIPYLTKALKLNPTIKFFGSAWSAPGWMKTSEKYDRFGYLKDQYYQVYANYLAKFAEEYQKHGLDMWAITTDNEPSLHYRVNATIMCTMGWIPEDLSRWVANNLGPALESSTSKGTRVLALDDNTDLLPGFINPLFKNQNASRYTIGTAIHWYADDKTSITVLDDTHDKFPDKIIIMTETSGGPPYWGTPNVASKIWNLGEKYMLSMIKHFNHWTVGWVDWNLVVDKAGGPNWLNVLLNAAIIANPEKDEFYKLSMYYAIKHFSSFVERNSTRIDITDTETIKATAFITPSKEVVVVLYNKESTPNTVTLQDAYKGTIQLKLSPRSMNTITYKL